MSGASVEVSVVLPAYNEEDTIEHTVRRTREALAAFLEPGTYEVVVAEDGCDDRTPEIADELEAEFPDVRHFHSDERLGRGGALNAAFESAEGDVLVYFDTDLATDMRHLEHLVESVRSGEYDVATGSRWMPENVADRPAKRGIPSRGFNLAVRTLLGSELRDHQCGFKAVSRAAFRELRPAVEDEHWFWDTELLVRAQRRGFRVEEFAVDWEPKGDSKVDLVRDVLGMGSQILRCWWEFAVSPYVNRRTGAVAGAALTLVALGLMFVYLDPSAVLEAAAGADPALIAVAGVVYALSWPLRGVRYRDILAELGYHEDATFLTGAVFVSQTGNLVFPARGGDLIRAYVVKARRRVPYTSGFASLAVERVFDLLTITLLAGSVLLGLAVFAPGEVSTLLAAITGDSAIADGHQQSGTVALAVAGFVGFAAVAAVAVIVLSARSDGGYVRRVVEWASDDGYVELVATTIEGFVRDVQTVAADGRAFARVGATSVLVWVIDVLTALCVFAAFGVDLPLAALLATGFFAVSVGNLAKVLPLSPGGIGLYEGAFTLLVVALTPVAAPAALAIALVDHAVKNAVTVVGGVVSMLTLNVSLTEAVDGASAEADPTVEATTDD
ncbi:flippase-like domain-containing protein [Halarchaeum sp. CBA1220]|uniref:flippase-like domain-containing protein n=1 Tax=Halarchaeum sp. CBA1220 TaxID=1853682 RepID=UPI000F3A9FC8|nr:flippase-like domain-containing protein [Halarchaeum sp. CBA1220]QLC33784.1 flippase-like domain-containing protein [Halarchaeum sp. CBA1220]